jgi:hypothetical protein
VDAELAEHVLNVGPGRIGTDHERTGDVLRVEAPRQERENLPFPPSQPIDPPAGVVSVLSPAQELSDEWPQHPLGDEHLTGVDRPHGGDQLRQWPVLRQEPARTCLEHVGEHAVVVIIGEKEQTAQGHSLAEGRDGVDRTVGQAAVEHGYIRPALTCGRDRLARAPTLRDDVEVGFPFKGDPDGFAEELMTGDQYPDPGVVNLVQALSPTPLEATAGQHLPPFCLGLQPSRGALRPVSDLDIRRLD